MTKPFLIGFLTIFSLVSFVSLSFMLFFNLTQPKKAQAQPVLGLQTQIQIQRQPVRLIIPSIKVDAVIQPLGLTSTGEMAVPNNTTDVGWYAFGPLPGEIGSAVIAGHVDSSNGRSGVFTKLHLLKEGDRLLVQDDAGFINTFVVNHQQVYNSGQADEVFNRSDQAHLNLVTCDGVWDKSQNSYTKRLVVFTDMITL